MLGVIKGVDESSSGPILRFRGRVDGDLHGVAATRSAIMVAALLGVALVATSLGSRRIAIAIALLITLALAGLAGGPATLAGGLGLAGYANLAERAALDADFRQSVSNAGGQCSSPAHTDPAARDLTYHRPHRSDPCWSEIAQPNSSWMGLPPSTSLMGRPRGVVYC